MAKTTVEPTRFSFAFLGKIAPAGRKVQGSNRPELTATSTKDKFVFNEKACLMLGIGEGSKVVMIDQNLHIPAGTGERLSQNERFFVAVAPEGFDQCALISATKAFSYSGVWSAMLMNDPEITEASTADLVRAGLGILRGEKGKNYVGTKKVCMEVVKYTETDEDGNVVEDFELIEGYPKVKLYGLKNAELRDHTPKSEASTEEDEA
jgi:hypothetical protein